jgi:methyl-accepting chemotaxis protein
VREKTIASVFTGRDRWLLMPFAWANAAGAVLAALYGLSTLHLDAVVAVTFGAMWGTLGTMAIVFVVLTGPRRVRTVRHLGTNRAVLDDDNCIAAIREARALPIWLRNVTQVVWPVTALGAAAYLRYLSPGAMGAQLRVVAMGLAFGTLSALLVYLLAARRARTFVDDTSLMVPAPKVIAALAKERTASVRGRIVALTVILVVIPSALMVDMTRNASRMAQLAVAEAPRAEQPEVARVQIRAAVTGSLTLALALVAFALLAAWLAGSGLSDPLKQIADESNRISRGDLRDVRVVAAEDEAWTVTATFTLLQAQLQDVIAQLQRAGISIGATTEQLMATSSKYESGAADQASSLNETSATTEELAQSARQISHNAGSVSDLAQKTLDAARAGQDSAEAFVSAVDRMKHDNQSIAEAVTRLQKRVQQIGRIVEFITTVADRSDLLALSAELEGTKAGEVGRGFTLVAAEMRRLAENVIESTNEIEELIGEIREATLSTVDATDRGMEHTESGTALAGAVAGSLSQVVQLAQQTSDSVRAISLATQQQQSSTDQLAEAMADILGITQQSLAATKQVTSANHELITLSGDLKSLVERFQTGQTR